MLSTITINQTLFFLSKIRVNLRILDVLIWGLWILLFLPTIKWLSVTFTDSYNIYSLFALIIISGLVIHRVSKQKFKINGFPKIHYSPVPTVLVTVSLISYLILERILAINIFSTVAFFLGTYGLLGFYLPRKHWRSGFLLCLLLIQTLPFGNQLDIYLGFPLRLFAAEVVEKMLSHLDISNITTETIIITENKAAQIDLPCSGLKGLWTGILFFFSLTWLEKIRTNHFWFLSLFLFIIIVVVFNIFRILVLVILDIYFELPQVASVAHIPLGVIGFIFSCILGWFVLQKIKTISKPKIASTSLLSLSKLFQGEKKTLRNRKKRTHINIFTRPIPLNSNALYYFLIAIIIIAITTHKSTEKEQIYESEIELNLPAEIKIKDISLSEKERSLLIHRAGNQAIKKRFEWNGISGTVLIAVNSNWRKQHKPEVCFQADGLKIDKSVTVLIDKNFPVKVVNFKNQDITASYWFQSPSFITEDFSSRVWAEIMGKESRWALVSILFDEKVILKKDNIKELHRIFNKNVNEIFNNNKTFYHES